LTTAPLHFFFQAEDGIRDFHVTGVQTCALPIYPPISIKFGGRQFQHSRFSRPPLSLKANCSSLRDNLFYHPHQFVGGARVSTAEIGRASCREGVEIAVGGRRQYRQ